MRFALIILSAFLLVTPIEGKVTAILSQVNRPEGMQIAWGKIFITERSTFFVYSLSDFSYITRFGQTGEGPGELTINPILPNTIRLTENGLLAEGQNKLIFYSKDFKVDHEVKKKEWLINSAPLGNNFISLRMQIQKNRRVVEILLLDSQFNVIKSIFQQHMEFRLDCVYLLPDIVHYAIINNKIYVEDSTKGFIIHVFDSTGKKEATFKKNYQPIPFEKTDKQRLMERLKEDYFFQATSKKLGSWKELEERSNFIFPEFFPLIQDMIIANNKLYISTYKRKANLEQYIVLDLKGNNLGEYFLPTVKKCMVTTSMLGRENRFYGIDNNNFYYLLENENTEEWELHSVVIK